MSSTTDWIDSEIRKLERRYKIGRALFIIGCSFGLTGFILLFTRFVLGLVFVALAAVLAPIGFRILRGYTESVQRLLGLKNAALEAAAEPDQDQDDSDSDEEDFS